jgi:predicted outer membrane repeat protein
LNNVSIINGNANEGAGVYVNEGAALLANSVLFANNLAANEGGAIYLCNNAGGQVNHCTFSSNVAANNGGAIYSLNYLFPVSNSHFAMNSANKGSAIYNCTVEGCTFEGNAQPEIYPIKSYPEIKVIFNQTFYQYGQSVEATISLPNNTKGTVNVVLSTKKGGVLSNSTLALSEGNVTLFVPVLPIELYILTVQYAGDPNYYEGEVNATFSILPLINMTDKVVAASYGQIAMDFGSISDDFVDIFIDGKRYASQRIDEGEMNYTFSTGKLPVGNHTITFGYAGESVDENLFSYWDLASSKYKPIEFNLEILPINVIIESETTEEYEKYEVRIYDDEGEFASDAAGTVEFFVNGVSAGVVEVVKGIALLDITKYRNGQYQISWKYSGDAKYNTSSGQTVMKINRIPVRIVASDLSIIYTSAKVYSVKVYGVTGKVAKGTNVVFLINNKAYKTVKTDANGVANVAITKVPGSYKITAKALGASITKKLTVKHALTLKTVKVKRSAKKLIIKATLKKIDGKFLKGKKITLKFNGKKFTAKTSKKGVAKFTIKSNVLKKLKAGKKVKYQATYKKDTVKKSVKVK